jgi:hypothetical protein
MNYELNKLIYLEEEKGYFIPCRILEVGLDATRITLNYPNVLDSRHTYVAQKLYSDKVIKSNRFTDDGFEALLRVDKISYSLHELLYSHTILSYKIKADIIDLTCKNISNIIVRYKNSSEYFDSFNDARSQIKITEDGLQFTNCSMFRCWNTNKYNVTINDKLVDVTAQKDLVDKFNKGSFNFKNGEPIFLAELAALDADIDNIKVSATEDSYKHTYTIDEIAEKVASVASEKLNTKQVKNNDNKVLIEFYGSPGSGKSLHAYSLSNYLKLNLKDKVVEFSKEQAQEMYWEGRISSMSNMIKVLGRQTEHYDVRFEGGADIVIADTALDLAYYYDKTITSPTAKRMIMLDMYEKYPNRIKIFCDRQGDESSYTTTGRLQTFEQSKEIDKNLSNMFKPFDVSTNDTAWQEKVLTLAKKMMYNE